MCIRARCDTIASPFIFGILNPKIYLPFDLAEEEQQWVLLHERSHIARRDFLLKPLFWLAVLLHWMNPLVWIAWRFYSRDVELACDERAIRQLDDCQKRRYGNTLLQLAVQTPKWSCPVAFGNNSVKQQIPIGFVSQPLMAVSYTHLDVYKRQVSP